MSDTETSKTEKTKRTRGPRRDPLASLIGAHWGVRIVVQGGGVLYLRAKGRPEVVQRNGRVLDIRAEWVTGTEHGDDLLFLDCSQVAAVAARRVPDTTEDTEGEA